MFFSPDVTRAFLKAAQHRSVLHIAIWHPANVSPPYIVGNCPSYRNFVGYAHIHLLGDVSDFILGKSLGKALDGQFSIISS